MVRRSPSIRLTSSLRRTSKRWVRSFTCGTLSLLISLALVSAFSGHTIRFDTPGTLPQNDSLEWLRCYLVFRLDQLGRHYPTKAARTKVTVQSPISAARSVLSVLSSRLVSLNMHGTLNPLDSLSILGALHGCDSLLLHGTYKWDDSLLFHGTLQRSWLVLPLRCSPLTTDSLSTSGAIFRLGSLCILGTLRNVGYPATASHPSVLHTQVSRFSPPGAQSCSCSPGDLSSWPSMYFSAAL